MIVDDHISAAVNVNRGRWSVVLEALHLPSSWLHGSLENVVGFQRSFPTSIAGHPPHKRVQFDIRVDLELTFYEVPTPYT